MKTWMFVAMLAVACDGGEKVDDVVETDTDVDTTAADTTETTDTTDTTDTTETADTTETDAVDTTETDAVDTTDTTDTTVALSFATDIQPLLNSRCAPCHIGAGQSGGLDLDNGFTTLVNVPAGQVAALDYVEPGQPAASYLWAKLNGQQVAAGGSGGRMPPGGALGAGDLTLIEDWITAGALP